MSTGVVAQLRVIQKQAEQAARSIRVARDQLPAESVGWDDDTVASVQIDVTGAPVGIRVADGWERDVPPDRLGPAVLQAAAVAAEQQGRELSRILSDPTWRAASTEPAARPVAAERILAPTTDPAAAPARTLDELAEAMIGELRDARLRPATPAANPEGRGSAAGGAVVVTLTAAGLSGCEIDGDWVASRTGFAVSLVTSEALTAARLDLAQAVSAAEPAVTGRRLDGMLAEAMAFLIAGSPIAAGEEV